MDEDLKQQLEALIKRVDQLESEVAAMRERVPQVDEDTIMAISAAVCAYLGVKAKVKQVRFANRGSWVSEGRTAVHRRTVPHVR